MYIYLSFCNGISIKMNDLNLIKTGGPVLIRLGGLGRSDCTGRLSWSNVREGRLVIFGTCAI